MGQVKAQYPYKDFDSVMKDLPTVKAIVETTISNFHSRYSDDFQKYASKQEQHTLEPYNIEKIISSLVKVCLLFSTFFEDEKHGIATTATLDGEKSNFLDSFFKITAEHLYHTMQTTVAIGPHQEITLDIKLATFLPDRNIYPTANQFENIRSQIPTMAKELGAEKDFQHTPLDLEKIPTMKKETMDLASGPKVHVYTLHSDGTVIDVFKAHHMAGTITELISNKLFETLHSDDRIATEPEVLRKNFCEASSCRLAFAANDITHTTRGGKKYNINKGDLLAVSTAKKTIKNSNTQYNVARVSGARYYESINRRVF